MPDASGRFDAALKLVSPGLGCQMPQGALQPFQSWVLARLGCQMLQGALVPALKTLQSRAWLRDASVPALKEL